MNDRGLLKKRILESLTGALPPMLQSVIKAQEVMSNPNSSLKELASVFATDQALSIRVLKIANSTYYGMSGKVTSLGQAAVLLGTKRLGEVITMAGASNFLGNTLRGYGLKSGELWRHSLTVAVGSKIIAHTKVPEMENEAFSSGLIHDSGKIMMDPYILEKRRAFEQFMEDGGGEFLEGEREILGFDHAEIGSEVCRVWGLPEKLTHPIKYHHDPAESRDDPLAYILYIADAMTMASHSDEEPEDITYQVDDHAMAFLSLGTKDLGEITMQAGQIVDNIAGKILKT